MFADPRRIAVAFCAIGAFLHLYAPQAVLPMMAREYGVGAADASLIITAGTLAVAATAPFTGALSDVIGRKRLIVVAMALLLIPATMTALAPTLNQVIFWRFVHGLLLPPIFAVTIAYIGDEWPPGEANAVFGIYASASAVGGFLGRFVPGMLTDYVGWRGGFLALACGSVICLVMVALLLTPERKFVRATDLGTSLRQMLAHLRNPRLLATYAVGFGVLFNFIATFTYLSFHLAAPPFNKSPAFLGSIFVVYLVGSVAALWLGRAIAWLGRRNFVLCVLARLGLRHAVQPDPLGDRDRVQPGRRLDLRHPHPGVVDELRRHHREDRHLRRGRALRHLVLYRRHVRRLAAGPCLRGRRLALFTRAGDRHAGDHGADRRDMVEAIGWA